jgi:CRISPR-associated endoribonuclease Cas6
MERPEDQSKSRSGPELQVGPEPCCLGCIRLELRAESGTVFPDDPTRALHGALHRAIERVDPDLSESIHQASDTPLVCSPLFLHRADARFEPVEREVRAGEVVWARIAALEGRTLTTLLAALEGLRWRGLPIVLERPFCIGEVALTEPAGAGLPMLATYADLAAMTRPAAEIALRFTSPTFFRQGGTIVPEPEAAPVFLSHFRRWRAFAGIALPGIDAGAIRRGVFLSGRPAGEVRPTAYRGLGERGFVGVARYGVDGDDTFRRGIATLATYAAYCGTGARTAFGMGQTVWVG